MSTQKIQTGDQVKVIAGSHKGLAGIVTKVIKKDNKRGKAAWRVVVSSLPKMTKFFASRVVDGESIPGQTFTVDRSVAYSNVMHVNEKGEVTRLSVQKSKDGVDRVMKKGGEKVVKKKMIEEKQPQPEANTTK